MKRSVLLEDVLTFLNHDFDATDGESNLVRMGLETKWFLDPEKPWSDWIPLARALQRELKEDLLNVFALEKGWWNKDWAKASPGAFAPIEVLVDKINALHLVPTWGVQFVNPRRMTERLATGERFWKLRKKALREGYADFLRTQGKRITTSAINEQMKKTPIPTSGPALRFTAGSRLLLRGPKKIQRREAVG